MFGNLEFYSVENFAGFNRQEQQPDLLSEALASRFPSTPTSNKLYSGTPTDKKKEKTDTGCVKLAGKQQLSASTAKYTHSTSTQLTKQSTKYNCCCLLSLTQWPSHTYHLPTLKQELNRFLFHLLPTSHKLHTWMNGNMYINKSENSKTRKWMTNCLELLCLNTSLVWVK